MSDKPKSRIDKIKSSPAAKQFKEEGGMAVAKTIGGFAKEGLQNMTDKVLDAVVPLDNDHMKTRQDHFNQATEIPIRSQDLQHAEDVVHTYHSKRMSAGTFKEGNVSSIMNGFANRAKKLPPEGY